MRKLAALTALCLLLSFPGSALGEPDEIFGSALQKAVSGRVVYLATPYGVTLPIKYRSDGTMSGSAKGIISAILGSKFAQNDKGAWWVSGGKLCQKWRNWLSGQRHCFRLRRKGRIVYWRADNGHAGTATISK